MIIRENNWLTFVRLLRLEINFVRFLVEDFVKDIKFLSIAKYLKWYDSGKIFKVNSFF